MPSASVIGYRKLVVNWDKCDSATEYAVICINKSLITAKSSVKYSRHTQIEFDELNQDHTYVFRVAVIGMKCTGFIWSKMSFPVQPIMQLSK